MTEQTHDVGLPEHLVILRTEDWVVNHRVDSALPGYLMVGARMPTNALIWMRPAALAELGPLLAKTQQALEAVLEPQHVYIGRYDHMSGFAFHFHVMPICAWVKQRFFDDPRYRVLRNLSGRSPADPPADETDGAELTLYVWREFCESANPPAISGPPVDEVVKKLKALMSQAS
jgi:diadenosine tetraphosphate (Ap4A) HIT family hydrolase